MSEHGGQLKKAASQYQRPLDTWLDLSTGINPQQYPIPALPDDVWQRLPEQEDDLLDAAKAYYQTDDILPVAGSQQAIQALPMLIEKGTVGLLETSYYEHKLAWEKAGHQIILLQPETIEENLPKLGALVLVHPNNPTGDCFSTEQLHHYHTILSQKGGYLVIDEAFMDVEPSRSLIQHQAVEGLIVLRSLGKFFGLAGLRVGFVHAVPNLLKALRRDIGPWPIAHASRFIAAKALQDTSWQQQNQQWLLSASERLSQALKQIPHTQYRRTALFHWLCTDRANMIFDTLAQQGILIRLFETPHSIRFGIPGTVAELSRLEQALQEVVS